MGRLFHIAEPDPVIRLDLTDALRTRFGTSPIVSESTLEPLREAPDMSRLCLLVSGSLVDEVAAQRVKHLLHAGARVVSVGRPRVPIAGIFTLDPPFTDAMILDAVSNDVPDLPARPPEDHT